MKRWTFLRVYLFLIVFYGIMAKEVVCLKKCDICQTKCADHERYCPNCGHRFEMTYEYDDETDEEPILEPKDRGRHSGWFKTLITVGMFIFALLFLIDVFLPNHISTRNEYESYEELVLQEPQLDVSELDAVLDTMHTIIPEHSLDYWIYENYEVDHDDLTSAYININKSDDAPYDGYYDLDAKCYEEDDWSLTRSYQVTFDPLYLEEIIQNIATYFGITEEEFVAINKERFENRFASLQIGDHVSFYLAGDTYNLSVEITKEDAYRYVLYIRGLDETIIF